MLVLAYVRSGGSFRSSYRGRSHGTLGFQVHSSWIQFCLCSSVRIFGIGTLTTDTVYHDMSVRGDQQLKVGPKSLEGVDQEETVDGHGHIGVVGTFGERGLHACHLKDNEMSSVRANYHVLSRYCHYQVLM